MSAILLDFYSDCMATWILNVIYWLGFSHDSWELLHGLTMIHHLHGYLDFCTDWMVTSDFIHGLVTRSFTMVTWISTLICYMDFNTVVTWFLTHATCTWIFIQWLITWIFLVLQVNWIYLDFYKFKFNFQGQIYFVQHILKTTKITNKSMCALLMAC